MKQIYHLNKPDPNYLDIYIRTYHLMRLIGFITILLLSFLTNSFMHYFLNININLIPIFHQQSNYKLFYQLIFKKITMLYQHLWSKHFFIYSLNRDLFNYWFQIIMYLFNHLSRLLYNSLKQANLLYHVMLKAYNSISQDLSKMKISQKNLSFYYYIYI